jgi:hypothetical protein
LLEKTFARIRARLQSDVFQKLLGKSKILNREGRKEIAKNAKKNYECSGAFREDAGDSPQLVQREPLPCLLWFFFVSPVVPANLLI